jgi:mono/diheme cytochrome c family protein
MTRYSLLPMLLLLIILAGCSSRGAVQKPNPLRNAYDTEVDWNNSDHLIPLNYQESQGKQLFYVYCVWCHADSTEAGPSNRSNLNPVPPLINDGAVLNSVSDSDLETIITLGGSAVGKSAGMPPYGATLKKADIAAIIAYMRAVAQPPYSNRATGKGTR